MCWKIFRISNLNQDDVHNHLDTLDTYTVVDTLSNAVNYRTGTEDTYRYVSSNDNLDGYSNFDRNSHDHSDSHSNSDSSYSTSSDTTHPTEVGQHKYKTMMSGMMTDMIKSTVSTAVDTVMESGSAKVTLLLGKSKIPTTKKPHK